MKVQTHCKNCTFIKRDSTRQTGCVLKRDEKLGVCGNDSENNFVLCRFCNTYRPDEWLNLLTFEQSLDPTEAVLKEVFPRFGFFIYFDSDDKDAIRKLETTIQDIRDIEGCRASYVVVVNDRVEYNEQIWTLFVENFEAKNEEYSYEDIDDLSYHVVQLSERPERIISAIDEAFPKATSGWIYNVHAGERIRKDIGKKIHSIVNIDMKQIVLVKPYDEKNNGLIFPAYLFKFLNGNKPKMFNDKVLDSDEFVTKIEKAQERTDVQAVFDWSIFDD